MDPASVLNVCNLGLTSKHEMAGGITAWENRASPWRRNSHRAPQSQCHPSGPNPSLMLHFLLQKKDLVGGEIE